VPGDENLYADFAYKNGGFHVTDEIISLMQAQVTVSHAETGSPALLRSRLVLRVGPPAPCAGSVRDGTHLARALCNMPIINKKNAMHYRMERLGIK